MDAVTVINNNLDVEKLLNYYGFENIKSNGNTIRCCCKIHGGNDDTAFVINTETGLWYCHTGGCGGGDIFTLIQIMEKVDFITSVRWLSNFFNIDIQGMDIKERTENYLKEIKKFILMMRKRSKKQFEEFFIKENIREVTSFRQFKEETLQHFKLGYVESVTLIKKNKEEYKLFNRLVIPIIFKGLQIGLSFRRIKSTDFPKWSHQPVNLEAGEILYNYDATTNQPIIVICEGITDVWAFYEIGVVAVATLGAHITEQQYKLILKTGADVVLAFDGDEAGRLATQKALKMFKNKVNLSQITFNEGEDPESIEREELKKRYDFRRRT